ncbi:SGNH/GDSL hydrolase family protein [Bacillus massiliglaciei]|uniref:SGNH/GDSL hydrolase family protein n=1 Tax=Bacillus massiliglaciei TaxID=1816693 RepID=UPI0018FE2B2C|nr:SGNH/GDSL hydrolase family protein [Bacillus massiliglaciei]
MKKFVVLLSIVACVITLVLGQLYWKSRLAGVQAEKTAPQAEKTESESKQYSSLTENWPKKSRDLYEERLKENKPFKILLAGSMYSDADSFSVMDDLSRTLKENYGTSVKVITKSYDLYSTEFVDQGKEEELAKEKADLILLEPFTLKNNGFLSSDDSLAYLSDILDSIQEEKDETEVILQPPYPLPDATLYPQQVNDLKEYAKENNLPYLDHWKEWPEEGSDELNDLFDENGQLKEEGYQIWADYLENYFVSGQE